MKKKAQNIGQILIYLIAIITVGVILLFGYNALRELMTSSDDITKIKFEQDLRSTIKSVTNQYGTYKPVELRLSNEYKEVCFLKNYGPITGTSIDDLLEGYTFIRDTFTDQVTKNVFVLRFDNQIESYNIEQIDVGEQFKCFEVDRGTVEFGIEGMGDHVLIK